MLSDDLSVAIAVAGLAVAIAAIFASLYSEELRERTRVWRSRLALWRLKRGSGKKITIGIISILALYWLASVWIDLPIPFRRNKLDNGKSSDSADGALSRDLVRPALLRASKAPIATKKVKNLRFVEIPAGSNLLGCVIEDDDCRRNELPIHRFEFKKPFWMTSTEVTYGQYDECVRDQSCPQTADGQLIQHIGAENLPITWIDPPNAAAFCRWANSELPTEIEWEYAARGGLENQRFPWGNTISALNARFRTTRPEGAAAVGSFAPNGYGLYDMSGNVAEWCYGPLADDGLHFIFVRGGSYLTPPERLRVSARVLSDWDFISEAIGFRCVNRD